MKTMCFKLTTILQFVVAFCHVGLLCYWVSTSCSDLSGGEKSLCCLFLCDVISFEIH